MCNMKHIALSQKATQNGGGWTQANERKRGRFYRPLSLPLDYTAKNCECRTRTGKYEWTFSALPNLLHKACFMTGLEPAKY